MIKKLRVTCAAVIYLVCATVCAQSESRSNLGIIQVQAQLSNSIESSDAASASVISDEVLTNLPLLRPGDVLDQVPGMVVTQHSGDGKANQYFLRGFNLDHGTDFATTIQGVPVNLPTNAIQLYEFYTLTTNVTLNVGSMAGGYAEMFGGLYWPGRKQNF